MPSTETLLMILLLAVLVALALLGVLLARARGTDSLATRLDALNDDAGRVERALREEQRAGRGELAQSFEQFRGHVGQQLDGMGTQQRERIDGFSSRLGQLTERTDRGIDTLRQGLAEDARKGREDARQTLAQFGEQLQARLATLSEAHERRMAEVRGTLDVQLKALQQDNAQQLEKMRATVDEKLQATLDTRLNQSFALISTRLEAVQRGLGEMQQLANGVGDLKRVLTNIKTRGTFGEVQLGALLEQILIPEQYAANVATVPGSGERVEYAIRLPGSDEHTPVWLPIDAKFPVEDYQRLVEAQELADAEGAQSAGRALDVRLREEARRIRDKYVAPPHSTDFGILFLPTEGLYAEAIRRPGLSDTLQRDFRITLAGPTTLTALLNSLQMGFRTLAIEKRSSEVWQLLGAVKNEFHKFASILERAEKQLNTVSRSIGDAGKKTRTIERRLRGVESLTGEAAAGLLGVDLVQDEGDSGDQA